MNVDMVELHDALIKNVSINFGDGTVTIDVAYYARADNRQRSYAALVFEDVDSISQISNVAKVRQSSVAGNINYWVPNKGHGTTYIYLVDGCIAVSAKAVRVDARAPAP